MDKEFNAEDKVRKCLRKMRVSIAKHKAIMASGNSIKTQDEILVEQLRSLQEEHGEYGTLAWVLLKREANQTLFEEEEELLEKHSVLVQRVINMLLMSNVISGAIFISLTEKDKNNILKCLDEYLEILRNHKDSDSDKESFDKLNEVKDSYGDRLGNIAHKMLEVIAASQLQRVAH